MSESRERRCVVLRGEPSATRREALDALDTLDHDDVLWVSEEAETRFSSAAPFAVKRLLGRAFDAVVLDLHAGLDADVLAQCHGFIWAGGSLVLRMPPRGVFPSGGREKLALFPYAAADVGQRFWTRFERCLERSGALAAIDDVQPASREVRGNEEQARAADVIARVFVGDDPAIVTLLADRGRGKSSALGLALANALRAAPIRVAVSAESRASAAEVFRFASSAPASQGAIEFVTPLSLAQGSASYDVIVIDEAAQLSVPLLRRIVRRHARAKIAFATTTRGYEGTGRGFVLRFLQWAKSEPRTFLRLELSRPIRYEASDKLERLIFEALLLDAEPASSSAMGDGGETEHVVLDRDVLAGDEQLLRDVFGLLAHAHYRTTPGDLHRLLDAPNLVVHALVTNGRAAATSLVAREGGLPLALCEELVRGKGRIRGHALADTLISHAGRTEAGTFRMMRSVRIAVHPALRKRGLGRALVEHVHRSHEPDLFGTIFGATVELVAFRRSLGYELVRLGVSRGSRTGEPAAVMLRPVTARARSLVESLRRELARDLPLSLELLDADGELLDRELVQTLRADLPAPPTLSARERDAIVQSYIEGPRPYESAATAIMAFVEAHAQKLAALDARSQALVRARVLDKIGWERAAADAGFETVPAAMRALRRAIRAMWVMPSACE